MGSLFRGDDDSHPFDEGGDYGGPDHDPRDAKVALRRGDYLRGLQIAARRVAPLVRQLAAVRPEGWQRQSVIDRAADLDAIAELNRDAEGLDTLVTVIYFGRYDDAAEDAQRGDEDTCWFLDAVMVEIEKSGFNRLVGIHQAEFVRYSRGQTLVQLAALAALGEL